MNDLYTQDKLARNDSDFGGSGVGAGHYTPQEEFREKLSEVKLPVILMVFAGVCFCILLFLTIQEVNLYSHGNKAEAHISAGGETATFTAPSGSSYPVSIGWANTSNSDGTITVYYMGDNYISAQPITAWCVYLIAYLFFGGIVGLLIFWMYKILHKTKHAEKAGIQADGYRSKFDE